MLDIRESSRFRRDIKRIRKRGKDIEKLETIIIELANGRLVDESYRDHALTGDWASFRDCHIEPDWLLIYRISGSELQLVRTGSHADLFQ